MPPRQPSPDPETDAFTQRAGIQSVEVGFGLLEVLSNAGTSLNLRDLAVQADMSAAKAHRYLVSFQRLGLVVQDAATTRYDLGPAALKLGLASLARIDAVRLARARIAPLMTEIGQTLALAVWGNQGPTLVHWEESPQVVTVSLRLGDVMPLLSSATGLCFAAFMATRQKAAKTRLDVLLKAELANIQKLGRNDLPGTLQAANVLLNEARHHGAARVVNTLLPGVGGFCVPVFDADGHMVLGMVALGSMTSFDPGYDGVVARPLKAAAQQLSSDLGYIAA
jgi:DNA-binding IclR family transcriptional regulator